MMQPTKHVSSFRSISQKWSVEDKLIAKNHLTFWHVIPGSMTQEGSCVQFSQGGQRKIM